MKRIWIGIVLLLVLLMAGIGISAFMEESHLPIARDVRHAGALAMESQWGPAQAYANRGLKQWEKKWPVTAAIADHEPMDEIDALFAQLKVYAAAKDAPAYTAACACLASQLEALSQSHSFNWWNLM